MNRGPTLKGLTGDKFADAAERAVRQLYQEVANLKNHPMLAPVTNTIVNPVQAIDPTILDAAINSRIEDIKAALQAGGSSPVQLDQLLGQTAQPQIPFAPKLTTLPPLNDPQSQHGSLVRIDNVLYNFNAQTDPGKWEVISGATPVVGGNERVYLQNRTQVVFSGAAATDGILQQNTPILPADFNAVGKILHVYANGSYRTQAAQTPLLLFKLALDFLSVPTVLLQWQTTATTANVINQWSLDAYISVNAPGGPFAGALRATGDFRVGLNAANFIETVMTATPFGGFVDLTINHSLDLACQISTQTGVAPFNSITQDWTLCELLN